MIVPSITGSTHVETARDDFRPFLDGDVNSGGTLVRVFDLIGLKLVMKELDTVADLTKYVCTRATFQRSEDEPMTVPKKSIARSGRGDRPLALSDVRQSLASQPVSQSASQPVSQSASQPVSQLASQPASQPVPFRSSRR
jgi:hypothetical protein